MWAIASQDGEAPSPTPLSSLPVAIYYGDEALIQLLLDEIEDGCFGLQALRDGEGRCFFGSALHAAIYADNETLVSLLLQRGADMRDCSIGKEVPLQAAASLGRNTIIDHLLDAGAQINRFRGVCAVYSSKLACPPLSRAVRNNHSSTVKLLLDRKALPNLRNDMGMGPLHFAAVRGNDDIVRLLLADPNIDVNLQCSNFFTPLEYAVASDHATIIRLLLERPDLELSCVKMARLAAGPASTGVPSEEFRMIMSRAEPDTLWGEVFREIQHKEDLTLMLLEKHAFDSKVYGRDPHKFAEEALCSAVGYGHFKILALLLDGGVDIEASRSLCTPLILAATAGNEAMVNILLDRGADAGVMRNGKLPFICAVKYGHLGVAQLLHRRAPDIDVNRRDAMGSTALSQATWYRRNSIVHWLLEECQADPNIGHFQFLTPIEIAAQCENNTAMVRAMLDKGATPNLKGHSGKALLNTDTVVGLLRAGANLRVGFSEWEPLLHWAVHKQEKRVLGTLLQRDDVRISHRDENGATPFWWAVFREYDEMVRLFLETEKDIALLVDGVSLPDYWVIRLYTVLERLGLALDYFDVL